MKSHTMISPEAAARLVFAPEEDFASRPDQAIHARKPARRHKPKPVVAYDAKFIKVSAVSKPVSDWRHTLDFGWLFGRATA
ncbi:MAG: hypothetical protein K0U74_01450 [Alphaproteobacteria bacterium]|nr:hypothetical protein [Alphaproteobacteria bacterium]